MAHFEKQVESKTVYEGLIVDVRADIAELQNGRRVKREVVVHPGGVGIVPLTDDNKIIMVRQYRYCMEEELIEIPAGKLEYGEDPFECAVRELSEETNLRPSAADMVFFGRYHKTRAVHGEDWDVYYFVVRGVSEQGLEVYEGQGYKILYPTDDLDQINLTILLRQVLADFFAAESKNE